MTDDQGYLRSRINSIETVLNPLGAKVIEALAVRYGNGAVTSAMRTIWGFPPMGLWWPSEYLKAMLRA